jgi:hypothetical protein
MRKRFRLMLAIYSGLFLLSYSNLNAQVYNGDIYLTTQAEVNAFNYTSVTGLLSVSEASPGSINTLNSLAGLTSVGSLLIFNNTALNIEGLSGLTSVEDNFRILNNNLLSDIGFSSLTSVGGSLDISNNHPDYQHSSISGLNSLTHIGGNLTISSNSIGGISGFHILNTIAGSLEISSNEWLSLQGTSEAFHNLSSVGEFFKISGNGTLDWSFENLSSVGTYLEFSGNDNNVYPVAEIKLVNLNSVGGNLSIDHNRDLRKIILPNLTSVQDLYIGSNEDLTNIEIDNLPSVKNLNVTGNSKLTYIGLTNLSTIEGNLSLRSNTSLTNIDGLSSLSSVGASVSIVSNDALINIDPLSNLSSVSSLEINDNDALTYLQFENLISVTNDLIIHYNDALPNLDGFAVLTSIGRNLNIHDNAALTNTFGFSPHNLTIGGSLRIWSNSSLVFIEGLSFIPSLGGDLEISGNPLLSNIQELENIGSIGGNIFISNNASLPFISFSDLTTLGGSLTINNNASLTNIYIPELTSVPGDLVILNNPLLADIDGTNLTSVGGFLTIVSNFSLVNLNGLSSLTSVGEQLDIHYNNSLTNLNGLSNLSSVGGYLAISTNAALTEFCGLYSLLSPDPNNNGLAGSYDVSGNAANPTEQQIIDGGPCNAQFNCDISSASFSNVSSCNDNGTPGNSADDFYTADLTVNFVNPPATGTLRIQPGNPNVLDAVEVAVGSLAGNSHTFTGVRLRTIGAVSGVEVEFSDDNACIQTATAPAVTFNIFPCVTPDPNLGNDGQAIEVGVKFQVTQPGYITGVRFYKKAGNTGTHIGHLWNSGGTQLAEATFINETASGWQEVLFNTPVSITTGTTYVASYFNSAGYYNVTRPYFTSAVVNGPVRALANGEDGSNGVFRFSPTPAFPASGNQASNFWVDVIFTTSIAPSRLITQQSSRQPSDEKTSAQKLIVKITPNPSADFFKLIAMSDDKAPISVRVLDISGRVLERYEKVAAGNLVQVGKSLRAGAYFAEVIQGDQRRVVKIIKVN